MIGAIRYVAYLGVGGITFLGDAFVPQDLHGAPL